MTTCTTNPPWATRILNEHWDALERRFSPDCMPVHVVPPRARQRKPTGELGCGSYGCVYRTSSPETVFKLTSDPSEAAFVTASLSLPRREVPWGIVRYHGLVEIPKARREKRRVFAIVREEAQEVGVPGWVWSAPRMDLSGEQRAEAKSWRELEQLLKGFKDYAGRVRRYIGRSAASDAPLVKRMFLLERAREFAIDYMNRAQPTYLTGAKQAATDLVRCEYQLREMASTDSSEHIGKALGYYLKQGMLLADVHTMNVGEVARAEEKNRPPGYWFRVITDPGHMVPLDPKWLSVEVPQL